MAMPQEVPHIDCSPAEWEMRVDLAAAFRLVDLYGWSDLLATHLSARVPGPEDPFLINPFGLMFDEITASNLVKVDQEGNVLSQTAYQINPARSEERRVGKRCVSTVESRWSTAQ